jgi:hypothetical protein
MQFNNTINSILEKILVGNKSVSPKPGRSISTTGRNLGQGTTSAMLPGEKSITLNGKESPGGLLPTPEELSIVKRIERRAKGLQNKKPVIKKFKK